MSLTTSGIFVDKLGIPNDATRNVILEKNSKEVFDYT